MALSSSKIGTARVLYFLNAAGMFHETARDLVILYSVAKNSSVMLHLERKAFYPATPPFPILHVAIGWDTA